MRLGLLLAELGQKAEVQVTDAEMTQAIMNQARQYPGQERQFFEFVQQNQQMQQQMRAPLFEDKVVDHVFEQATLNEKEVSKEDLQKAVEVAGRRISLSPFSVSQRSWAVPIMGRLFSLDGWARLSGLNRLQQ